MPTAIVQFKGKQKAAMLLMGLDANTAGELLKGMDPQSVQELALELAYLDASGYRNSKESLELAKEFCTHVKGSDTFHFKTFLEEMLKSAVGFEKAQQIQKEISNLLHKRDPFMQIRSVGPEVLAKALENEHPQAIGVVLSELDAKKSSAVLSMLGEGVRLSVISRMTTREAVGGEARLHIAKMVDSHLKALTGAAAAAAGPQGEQSLRKVAVILRNLGQELRDGLLSSIREKDAATADSVAELMIIWEDIPLVADRSCQQALRGIEAGRLALALRDADEAIKQKIRSNISERANAMVDEETSLMGTVKKEDMAAAREEIVKVFREMNIKGELMFAEGQ